MSNYTEFELPSSTLLARAAMRLLANHGSYVVFHASNGSISIACNEREAIELADPNNGDSYWPIEQIDSELTQQLVFHEPGVVGYYAGKRFIAADPKS